MARTLLLLVLGCAACLFAGAGATVCDATCQSGQSDALLQLVAGLQNVSVSSLAAQLQSTPAPTTYGLPAFCWLPGVSCCTSTGILVSSGLSCVTARQQGALTAAWAAVPTTALHAQRVELHPCQQRGCHPVERCRPDGRPRGQCHSLDSAQHVAYAGPVRCARLHELHDHLHDRAS